MAPIWTTLFMCLKYKFLINFTTLVMVSYPKFNCSPNKLVIISGNEIFVQCFWDWCFINSKFTTKISLKT